MTSNPSSGVACGRAGRLGAASVGPSSGLLGPIVLRAATERRLAARH